MCSGCGASREESFDIENMRAYHAEPYDCHSCGARERAAYSDSRENKGKPLFGRFYAVTRRD